MKAWLSQIIKRIRAEMAMMFEFCERCHSPRLSLNRRHKAQCDDCGHEQEVKR